MGVEVEVVLSLETTFRSGWVAGENGTKAISTQDQMKLKLKFELSLAIYTSKQNLEQHTQSVHEKLKHYCVYCNSSFKKTQSYKKHLQSKHTPKVRYDIPM